jgi:uroporphyrinogen decarboxylase
LLRGLEFVRSSAHEHKETKSLNEGAMIVDQESYDHYIWPEITSCNFELLDKAKAFLPSGMKLIPYAYDGILENAIGIVGYENLCYMLYDEPGLVEEIFNQIGSRIKDYYFKCLEYDTVGAIILNDDWGFNTQTMLAPRDLRKFVFPYYKEIVKRAHELGKYTILHSCGYYQDIIGDIVDELKIDARHSYEDNIIPVEQAYEDLKGKIAVMGGIDVDFLVRSSEEEIYQRAKALLNQTKEVGGYALGSGNSIPEYVPLSHYLAMVKAAWEEF